MIQLIVFDIDGVITDGSVIIDTAGNEQKKVNMKDIDAIFELHRRGFKIAAITGEETSIVNYFEKDFRGITSLKALKQNRMHWNRSKKLRILTVKPFAMWEMVNMM